jgi:hypothetical protein
MTDVVSPILKPAERTVREVNPPVLPNDVIIESPVEAKESPDIENLLPLDRYAADKGQPYTADYLGIYYYPALTKELDVNSILPNVKRIEQFVNEEIAERKLTNTVGSYQEIMNRIKEDLHISDNEIIESKIEKIVAYIKAMEQQRHKKKLDENLSKIAVDLKSIFRRVET